MAGVPAGRLSIEIVAEVARLQADLDKAKRAVNAASKDIASSARHANDNLAGMAGGITKAGNSSRLASHHVQNLAFQFQDIAVSLASGQRPMTVFMQQGSQVAGIMTQAGIGVGGLVKQIGMMATGFIAAHPVMAAVAAAAGLVAGALALVTGEINKNSSVTVTWSDTLMGTFDAIKSVVEGGLVAAFEYFGVSTSDIWGKVVQAVKTAMNIIIGLVTAMPRLLIAAWQTIPGAMADVFYTATNGVITAINLLVQKSIDALNGFINAANSILSTVGAKVPTLTAPQIAAVENSYAGAGRQAAGAMIGAMTDTFSRDWIGQAAEYISPFAQDRARARMAKDAESAAKAAGGRAGKALGKATGEEAAKEMRESFSDAFKYLADDIARSKEYAKRAANNNETLDGLKREAEAIGLVGWAREKLIMTLEHQAKVQALIAEQQAAILSGDVRTAEEIGKLIETERQLYDQRLRNGNAEEQWRAEQDAIADVNDELQRMVDALYNLRGAGRALGGLLAFMGGDIEGISGPIGDLLRTQTGNRRFDKETGKMIAETVGDQLRDVFGVGGEFGQTMTQALQAAGIGAMAGQALFGGKSGSAIGAGLGAILGKEFMTAAAGPLAIASAANQVIGDIFGFKGGPFGVLTSAIGDLVGALKGGRSAGAVLTGGGAASNFGGSKGNYGAANDLAGAVTGSLNKIAEALGGTVGAFNTTIGIFKDQIRVNTSGGSTLKGSGVQSFGKDAEAAVAAALADAIRDGALQGLSAGAQALISKGGDLEAQLAKALAFEGVFTALEEAADPAGAALRKLEAEFTSLKAIFDEAGASTEERAKLEELYQRRRAELDQGVGVDDGGVLAKKRELEIELMALQGNAVGALAAARQQELAALDPSLHALQEQVWAEQELAAQREAAAQEARNIAAMQVELLQAQGREAEAIALQREQQLAGMTAAEAALQKQIWSAQAATDAAKALAQAQADQAASAQAAAERLQSLEIRLMQAEGNESGVRNAQRAAELAAAQTEAEKALLKQIYEAEDAARRAAEAASRANSATAAQDAAAAEAAKNAEQRERARLAMEEERQRRVQERTNLELELLRATARGEEAIAIERNLALKTLPKELHALQRRVWAAQDAARAEEEASRRVDDARKVLTDSYNRESNALKATIDRFKGFAESLSEFRRELVQGETETGNAYQAARERFQRTNALAAIGDEKALGQLQSASSAFLEASRANSGSAQQYQRDLASVLRGINTAVGATDGAIDYAELQLEALDKLVSGWIEINRSVVSVEDAIKGLQAAGGAPLPGSVPNVPGTAPTPAQQASQQQAQANEALQSEIGELRESLEAALTSIAIHTSKTAKVLTDASAGDTIQVSGVQDSPLYNAPVTKNTRGKWEPAS